MKYSTLSHEKLPWTDEYDDYLFINFVAPITHFDEKPEPWMKMMREHIMKSGKPNLLADATTGNRWSLSFARTGARNANLKEVAQHVVENIWSSFGYPNITFKADQTPQVLSPLSTLLVKRHGSCTAMSIFLSDALRSLGVPSRVVGIERWNRVEGGNHNWVEAYFDGKWNFIDAVPGVTTWNTAWFTQDGTAQKSEPYSASQIATPVWDTDLRMTDYHVAWFKEESPETKLVNDVGDTDVHLNLPAIDRTNWYRAKPNKTAPWERDGCKFSFSLSSLPLLALVFTL